MSKLFRSIVLLPLIAGIVVITFFLVGIKKLYSVTSTDRYCMSCHVHTEADMAWK